MIAVSLTPGLAADDERSVLPTAAPSVSRACQQPWLPVRQELQLEKGPLDRNGSPAWILHDPAANRFFRIGWLEFEILNHWDLGDPQKIAEAIIAMTTLTTTRDQVERFFRFLQVNDLLIQPVSNFHVKQQAHGKKNFFKRILNQYLYFRIPLIHPDAFLNQTLPWVKWIFSPAFLFGILAISVLSIYLMIGDWSHFIHGFNFLTTPQGAIFFVLSLFVSKCCHELGHGYAAVKYGSRVPTMGLGIMMFWPILWTDTSHAWKIRDRSQRLVISAAGVYIELILAVVSTLLWSFLPDGPFRSSIQLMAASTWMLTLAVNLNPFMKFDGYFLVSDLLDIPNLQARSMAISRWWLNRLAFGLDFPPPELLPRDKERMMILYSMGLVVYRVILYLSIALTIYFFFFKALGLALVMAQIARWTVPLIKQIVFVFAHRDRIRWFPNVGITLLLMTGIAMVFVYPWHGTVTVPAILKSERDAVIYAPLTAQIDRVHIQNGQHIKKGAVMVRLTSPETDHHIQQTLRKIKQAKIEMEQNQAHGRLIERNVVKLEEYHSLMADLHRFQQEKKDLIIPAPFDGIITDMPTHIKAGDWVKEKEVLGLIIQQDKQLVIAFVPEMQVDRVAPGQQARFCPDGFQKSTLSGQVNSMDSFAIQTLIYPELASIYGGSLPVQKGENGTLLPVRAFYQVQILPPPGQRLTLHSGALSSSGQMMTGQASIQVRPIALFKQAWTHAAGVFLRESAF